MAMMERLLRLMAEKKASDLFLSPGSPVQLKISGVTVQVNAQRLDEDAWLERLRSLPAPAPAYRPDSRGGERAAATGREPSQTAPAWPSTAAR